MAEHAADRGLRDVADQGQDRRIGAVGGQERRRGVEQARSGHHRIGLGAAGGERGAERHIGGALLMAGVHGADAVGGLEQGIEQGIVVDAGQRIDGVEPMGDERRDRGFGRGHVRGRRERRSVDLKGSPSSRGFQWGLGRGTRGPSLQIGGSVSRALCRPARRRALTSAPLHVPFRATFTGPINTMHRYRSHTCGELRAADIGREVRLSGWCHRIRDHGGLLFIDLRDHYGLTQCVADPDSPAFKEIEKLRSEWVVRLDGKVRAAPGGHRESGSADRRGRTVHQRHGGARAPPASCRCRCSASTIIPRK